MNEKNEPTAILSRTGSTDTGHNDTERHLKAIASILRGLLEESAVPFDPAELCTSEHFTEVFGLLSRLVEKTTLLSPVKDRPAGMVSESDKEHEILLPVFAAITDAVFVLDNDGRIILGNPAVEDLCKKTIEEIRGKQISEVVSLVHEMSLEPCDDIRETVLREDGPREQRCVLTFDDGAEKTVTMHGEVLRNSVQQPLGIVVIIRDCTKQELFEEKLLRIRKLESVGLLAGGIAHDFNNILTGIITNLFMARMSVFKNEEACQLIADAEKAAFKATRLTKQLLTFSMGGAPVKELISLSQLIEETVGFSLSGSNVDYRLHFDDDLKPVEVDKGQIDQVLNNLVINAAQAMPEGGTVTITAENYVLDGSASEADSNVFSVPGLPLADGEYVKISIRDDGPGIPRKHLGKIFDPYFSTKTGSTGLGLTTAYSIIKKHGGHIEVESRPGEGAIFSFCLPAVVVDNEEKLQNGFEESTECGRVLVMDDDIIIRTVVEKLLKKTGYSVVCVSNGDDALQQYSEAFATDEPFHFVLMDLTIPGGMGGKETVTRMKEFDQNAKVIVFSGYSNDPILSNYKEYGFDGVLKKPFNTEELLLLIKSIGGKPREI